MATKTIHKKTIAGNDPRKPHRYDYKVKRTLQPGDKGTQRYLDEYHEALYCVRYRDDEANGLRFTTVELVRNIKPLARRAGPFALDEIVSIRFPAGDTRFDRKLARWGGQWDVKTRSWLLPYKIARRLRIASRAKRIPQLQPA